MTCWADRCCFFVKLDLGCILLGIGSFIFSIVMTVSAATFLGLDMQQYRTNTNHNLQLLIFEIDLHDSTYRSILISMITLGLILMLTSALLLFGIQKKRPGYVLLYFGFGIFFVIFCKLGALLLLLDNRWIMALVVFIISLIYDHFLVVVHTFYDRMQKGSDIFHSLVEDDTVSIISQDTNASD